MDTPRTPKAVAILSRLCQAVALIVAIGLLFLGLQKAGDFEAFRATVASHGLISDSPSSFFAALTISIEVGTGFIVIVFLLARDLRPDLRSSRALLPWGLVIRSIPFLLFAAYAAGVALHPPDRPTSCGCGISGSPVRSWWRLAITDAGVWLVLLSAAGLARRA